MSLILIFLSLVFVYSLVSGRLERTIITAPIVFTVAGFIAIEIVETGGGSEGGTELFLTVAEIGLVLLLFTDASRTDLRVLRSIRALPARLLSIGMLLTILLGGVGALLVFPQLTIWEAGILAAILAPTDAGLGQIIVSSPRVPMKIRQALNVEAGLNDGLSVPFLLFFMALAAPAADGETTGLMRFIVEQLGYGALVGGAVGLAGGWLLRWSDAGKWMSPEWRQLGAVVLPLLCLLFSEHIGASPFIAAFVAGLAVQVGYREAAHHSVEFTESWGQLVNLSVFFLFGLLVARAWPEFSVMHLVYAGLSLTVVRMLPVAMALMGSKLSGATVLFMGWFGPRGLASIVLGLVFLEHQTHVDGESTIRMAVMLTVLCSILAHGMTALPGMERYAASIRGLPPDAPELAEAGDGSGPPAAHGGEA